MSRFMKDDIIRLVEEEDVEFIRLQFTDLFGTLKNVAITSSQMEKAVSNKCMFDGSSIERFAKIEEPDMYLYPDLDSFATFPWRPQQGKVARFICDVYRTDGTPYGGDSRYVLKKVLKKAEDLGYVFNVGPELEFFLFDVDDRGNPTTQTKEKAGYFDLGPLDLGENVRRDMVLTLEEMGFEIESSHHEAAPAQHEIDFKYADALTTADNIMTFKLAVRTIAKRHGFHATFMPKPRQGVDGSGMHINMSLSGDGRNLFYDPEDQNGLSPEAYWFMGGIMKHIRAITAVTNPLVNSYKRLVPGYEAPIYNTWSTGNTSSLIRIPAPRGEGTRVELRSPDPSCNPYLALAVCLEAGLDGIRNRIQPPESVHENVYAMSREEKEARGIVTLPGTLNEALLELEQDELIMDALGEIGPKFLAAKRSEWEAYCAAVTKWELEQYLYRV